MEVEYESSDEHFIEFRSQVHSYYDSKTLNDLNFGEWMWVYSASTLLFNNSVNNFLKGNKRRKRNRDIIISLFKVAIKEEIVKLYELSFFDKKEFLLMSDLEDRQSIVEDEFFVNIDKSAQDLFCFINDNYGSMGMLQSKFHHLFITTYALESTYRFFTLQVISEKIKNDDIFYSLYCLIGLSFKLSVFIVNDDVIFDFNPSLSEEDFLSKYKPFLINILIVNIGSKPNVKSLMEILQF